MHLPSPSHVQQDRANEIDIQDEISDYSEMLTMLGKMNQRQGQIQNMLYWIVALMVLNIIAVLVFR
jgi:hypothetical protein